MPCVTPQVTNAGRTGTPEIEAIIEREREQRRQPGRAEIIYAGKEIMRRAQLQGFIAPKGWPGSSIDLCIAADGRGLQYCAEKTYTMVEAVNFIIANSRARNPDFGLRGSLFAETEFAPYHWLGKIGPDGWAVQQPCRITRAIAYSLRRYAEHLRLNWTRPATRAAAGRGPTVAARLVSQYRR